MRYTKGILSVGLGLVLFSSAVNAGLINDGTWAGWTEFAAEDQEGNFNYVDPGYGGQQFDAEYLLYKLDGTTLSIGLQTGFDIIDGHQLYSGKNYWAGDLALSFDGATLGDAGSYEYAVDFGLEQCGWSQRNNADCGDNNEQGLNAAEGVYQVSSWNNDVYSGHTVSNPFAMSTYSSANALSANMAGVSGDSYYRQVSFDLAALGFASLDNFDAHWTMSCGNDAIDGNIVVAEVPEPSSIALLALGLIGLLTIRRKS